MTAALLLTRRPYRRWWGQQRRSPDKPYHPSRTCTHPAATKEPSTSSKTPPTLHTVYPPTIWQALLYALQDYQTQQQLFPTGHQTAQLSHGNVKNITTPKQKKRPANSQNSKLSCLHSDLFMHIRQYSFLHKNIQVYITYLSPCCHSALFTSPYCTILLHLCSIPQIWSHFWNTMIFWKLVCPLFYYMLCSFVFVFIYLHLCFVDVYV